MTADLPNELIELLEKIVLDNSVFSDHRFVYMTNVVFGITVFSDHRFVYMTNFVFGITVFSGQMFVVKKKLSLIRLS